MSSTDSVASGLWLSHVSPQHSEQLWSQAAPPTHHHHHHAAQQKDQEFASALSAFQAAVAPENRSPPGLRSAATSATTVPTTTTTPPPAPMVSATGQQQQQSNAPSLPSPAPQLLQGFNGGLVGIVPPTLVAQPNASINMVQPQVASMPQQQQPSQAQQQQQQPFFVQFLGYLPDGRPMFVPAPAVMAAHAPQQLVQAPTPGLQMPLQPVVVPNGTLQLPLTSTQPQAPSLAVSHQNVTVLNNTYQQQQQQSTMLAPKPQPLQMMGVALADVSSPPKPKEAAADKPSTSPAPPPVVVRQQTSATPLSVPVVVTTPLSRPLVQSTVTVIGGNAPTSNNAPAVVSAVKGLRPTPLSGVNGVGATPPAAAPASSTPAAMGASGGITVRVGVTAAETPTPVTVTVGQTPTAAHHPKATPVAAAAANVANAAASPSVVVGQRPAAATGGALTPAVSVRVGVTPSKASPATTPVSVRVGAAAGGNLASAVASMPLSKKPDAPGSHENSAAASPLATVGEARSDATPATAAAPAVVNSLAGNRPPVLNASSPTAAIVQRAVLDGMTPTVTPTNSVRRGRTSQLPTPLGALQSPSVRVGLVPLTSVTVGARPTPTAAAMSVTVAGMTVPSLAPPVGGKPPALVVAPPRLQESSDTAAAAQESDAWARFEASSTLRSAVPPPLLSVAVPVSLKPSHLDNGALGGASQHKLTPHESSMRDHHRRRDGSNTAVSPHRSVSEVASRLAAEPSPPHHDASRSSSTTTSTVSSLPWKPAYKTRLCRSWMSAASSCKYGSKCMFAHGEAELVVVREAAQATDAAAGRDQGSRGSSQSDSSSRRYVGVQAMHMDVHGAAR